MATAAVSAEGTRFERVDVRQVKVGGEIGRRIDITVENNVLALDVDKDFLAPFQKRESTDGYIGLGKFIDSVARLAVYTKDERVEKLRKHLVEATLATQEPDGYIGMMKPEARIDKLWDVHEMAYLVLGLTTDYEYFGEQPSLDGARKLADYLMTRLENRPPDTIGTDLTPDMPTTGLEEAFFNLAEQADDTRYRDFARDYRPLTTWNSGIVLGRWGDISGHAYAHIDKCLAQLRLATMTGDTALLEPSRNVLEFLQEKNGLVITGTCGDHECWHDTQSGTTNLGETCTTAYLLRFYDELMRQTGDARYGDLMERAIFNALFGAQSPDGRRIRYYTPFEAPRVYNELDTYCCPCNYRRIVSELPELIYYRLTGGIAVNLYTSSKATIEVKGYSNEPGFEGKVTIEQETDFPNSGRVTLKISPEKPGVFGLWYRTPFWCVGAPTISVPPTSSSGNGFYVTERMWVSGDRVEIEFPMSWRLIRGHQSQVGRVAVTRGPQVFAFNPKANPGFENVDPRLLTLDPESIEGPFPDDTVRKGGLACHVRVWEPGAWYPHAATKQIKLTEYPDPDATGIYFLVPSVAFSGAVDDSLRSLSLAKALGHY